MIYHDSPKGHSVEGFDLRSSISQTVRVSPSQDQLETVLFSTLSLFKPFVAIQIAQRFEIV